MEVAEKNWLEDGASSSEHHSRQEVILSAAPLQEGHQNVHVESPSENILINAEDNGSTGSCSIAMKTTLTRCQIVMFLVGLFLMSCGIAMLAGGYQAIFDAIMQMSMEVKEGSISYGIWKTTPFPLIMKIYIWNITNGDDFVKGATPDLQECGPYVWKEYHEKKDLIFHDNHTVTYFQQRWWVWDEGLSGNNSRDDIVYTLNAVPVSAAWTVRDTPWMLNMLNLVFNNNNTNETPIVRTTVNEIIFTGFQDPVLDWVQKYADFILQYLPLPPALIDYDRFGWFYKRNLSLSYDGVFNMMTGTDDIKKVGQIDLWNYTRNTKFFDPPCNEVTGSAGEYFESDLQRDKVVLYSSDLCMSMALFYRKDVVVRGVSAYHFWGNNDTFTIGLNDTEDDCYCVKGTCAPSGLINAESCRMGAPAFVSFPHYFNADPNLLEQVNGLSPEEDKHAFVMDVMPETGVPVRVKARMQINLKVTPYPGKPPLHNGRIDILKSVPDIYLPMIWFEELAEVPDYMSGQLSFLQFIMNTPFVTICFSLMLASGVAMIAYVIIAYLWRK